MWSSHYWLARFFQELPYRTARAPAAKSVRSGPVARRGFASNRAGPRDAGIAAARSLARRRRRPPLLRIRQTLQPFWYRS